jgi:hypothetical protein
VESALGNIDSHPTQQLMGLHHRQILFAQPLLQLLVMSHQHGPSLTVPLGPMRADPLANQSDQAVSDLALIAILAQADLHAGRHVPIDRLAVHPRHAGRSPLALATDPQSQHFFDLVHRHLPEHRHLPGSLADGGESNGGETSAGGPSQVAP